MCTAFVCGMMRRRRGACCVLLSVLDDALFIPELVPLPTWDMLTPKKCSIRLKRTNCLDRYAVTVYSASLHITTPLSVTTHYNVRISNS